MLSRGSLFPTPRGRPGGSAVASDVSPSPVTASLSVALREFERDYLQRALALYGGKRGQTADALGISRKTLWEKLRALGIADADVEPETAHD